MTISITQKHIDEGVRNHSASRMVALAIEEATGTLVTAVGRLQILWGDVGGWLEGSACKYWMKTPPAVREFLDRYDSELPVEPISFELKAA